MSDKGESSRYKGWLWKWTNYVKGYQKRWFVLSNGLLSYYKSQAEVSVACRGTVILAGATIVTEDSCHFTISNGSAHRYHLKAGSEVERQKWITALELAKSVSTSLLDSEESSDGEASPPNSARRSVSSIDRPSSSSKSKNAGQDTANETSDENKQIKATLVPLEVKLTDLETCNKLIGKHGAALLGALAELENLDKQKSGQSSANLTKLKAVNERAMLFRITSSAMISSCNEFLQVAKVQSKKWQKMLTHERDQRLRLEETVETLAKQHNSLERALNASTGPPISSGSGGPADNPDKNKEDSTLGTAPMATPYEAISDEEEEDDEFVDAYDEAFQEMDEAQVEDSPSTETDAENYDQQSVTPSSGASSDDMPESTKDKKTHRTRIPFKPNYKLNLWSIMKNCIGRDLSKIPMPVNFSEPLSMLQRITEDMEYADILDRAARLTDSCEQLAHVAAFSISSYSTTLFRTNKPFNPLLGETYEFDMVDELGYRCLVEQVSHHPPSAAMHVESPKTADHGGWSFWQQVTLASKFRGKYLSITPIGTCHLKFHRTGHHYTWNKVTITVHNIIVGKLWVDQSGESDFVNHVTGDKCKITFFPYSYFSRDVPRKVSGTVIDKDGNERFSVFGTWDAAMKYKKIDKITPKSQQETLMLWQKFPLPPLSEKMYYFTRLALILNEPLEGTAPTDSRLRPDQRKMEDCAWDEANKVKLELEEKQRFRRKMRELVEASRKDQGLPQEPYKPRWFKKILCPLKDEEAYVFNNEYWQAKEKQDWRGITDIFDLSKESSADDSNIPSSSTVSAQRTDLTKSASEGGITPSFTKQPVSSQDDGVL